MEECEKKTNTLMREFVENMENLKCEKEEREKEKHSREMIRAFDIKKLEG